MAATKQSRQRWASDFCETHHANAFRRRNASINLVRLVVHHSIHNQGRPRDVSDEQRVALLFLLIGALFMRAGHQLHSTHEDQRVNLLVHDLIVPLSGDVDSTGKRIA
jgi:hypothetical protein